MDDSKKMETSIGFSPVSSTPVFWKSRKRSASAKNLNKEIEDNTDKTFENKEEHPTDKKNGRINPAYSSI